MEGRGETARRLEEKKRPPRNQKKAAAEQKAAAGKFSRGGLYCDIEFLSVPSLTIA